MNTRMALAVAPGCLALAGCSQDPENVVRERYQSLRQSAKSDDPLKLMIPEDSRIVGIQLGPERASLLLEDEHGRGVVEMKLKDGGWSVGDVDWLRYQPVFSVPFTAESEPTPARQLTGHQAEVDSLAFSPDGSQLISASHGDNSIKAWSPITGTAGWERSSERRPKSLAVTPEEAVVADVDGNLTAYRLDTGAPRMLASKCGTSLAASPDGRWLAAATPGQSIQLLRLPDGTPERKLEADVERLAVSPDGRWLAGAAGNRVTLWRTRDWKRYDVTLKKVDKSAAAGGLAFTPDSRKLLVASYDSSVVLLDVESRRELFNTYVSQNSAMAAAAGPVLVTGGANGKLYMWSPEGKKLAVLEHHRDDVRSLAFSPDGSALASGSQDRSIVLWSSDPGEAAPRQQPSPTPKSTYQEESTDVLGHKNLLRNPNATNQATYWRKDGEAAIGQGRSGAGFEVRHGGSFYQDIRLPRNAQGKYVVILGRVASERIHADGGITGLPYLYGYLMRSQDDHIQVYMQERTLTCSADEPERWVPAYAVYQVPNESDKVRLFLNQASGQAPPTDSAARFDDLAVVLTDSKSEADRLVQSYIALP